MDTSKKYSLQVFEGKTKISTTCFPNNFTVKTEHFSPLPDENIVFYFEACHTQIFSPRASNTSGNMTMCYNPSDYPKYEFVLKLIRPHSSHPYPSVAMEVVVRVHYSDGSLLKKYAPLSNIKIDQMSPVVFEAVTHSTNEVVMFGLPHTTKMRSGVLTINVKMFFNSDIPTSPHNSSNFANNLKAVYESSLFNDFVIDVGDKSFPVHKVILVAHSPVFTKMLTQDCLESKTNRVTITDATPETFDLFLKYLYSGEICDKSWPSVKDLYGLADKYDVEILRKDCADMFISLMSVDLVCEILKLAYTYNDSSLKSAAKSFAVNHIKELISRDDWKHLVAAHPIIGYEVIVYFVPS